MRFVSIQHAYLSIEMVNPPALTSALGSATERPSVHSWRAILGCSVEFDLCMMLWWPGGQPMHLVWPNYPPGVTLTPFAANSSTASLMPCYPSALSTVLNWPALSLPG